MLRRRSREPPPQVREHDFQALQADPGIGLLLPCNVVVRQTGEHVTVEAMDPGLMATMSNNDDLAPIATEARALINQALGRLSATPELSA